MDDPVKCLNCKKLIQLGSSKSVQEIKSLAKKDKSFYKYLVCSEKCYLKIVGDNISKLEISEIPLFVWFEERIKYKPEFTYLILDKIVKDESKSKEWGRESFKVDWRAISIHFDGSMRINSDLFLKVTEGLDFGLRFGSAAFSNFELGLWDGIKTNELVVRWNNKQYIEAQRDKYYCDKELLQYKNSEKWLKRKKYFDNLLTEFREWYRHNKITPPEIDYSTEQRDYNGKPKSPKVRRLLEMANEQNLKKGETPPRDILIEIYELLKNENLGYKNIQDVRRTLTKYGYSKTKTSELERHNLPHFLPKK